MTGQQKLIFVQWQVLTKAIFALILELKVTTSINKCFIANGKELKKEKKNERRGKKDHLHSEHVRRWLVLGVEFFRLNDHDLTR